MVKDPIAKLFHPDGRIELVRPANGKSFEYEELTKAVGGYIEILNCPGSGDAIMVINEEGKLNGLPYNELATKVWLYQGDLTEFGTGKTNLRELTDTIQGRNIVPQPADFIVGPALLCHTSQVQ